MTASFNLLNGLTISFCLFLACPAVAADPTRPDRPNVIVIMTDDQGSIDARCYGADDLETPTIDRLASRGIRFTQFYCAAPVCSPSRAALLTGRYPLTAGLTTNASDQPGGKGLRTSEVTMAEMFKAAGYATGHFGKWHLGSSREMMPNAQGFDYSFGHMGGCIDNYSHFFYWNGPNRHDLYLNGQEIQRPGQHFGDLMVDEASQFMTQHRSEPFFIYFALNMPHYPYQGDTKWLERYRDLPYPRNLYAAFLSSCDDRMGRLLHKVEDLGLREKTIIVFQSDNGHSQEDRAHHGGGSAGRYRGAKFSMFEGGIRLPGLISWSGHLPEGVVRDQVVHSCDWLPTLAELCSVKPPDVRLDGRSIVPVIRSETAVSPHETLHWQLDAGKEPQWAIRHGDWKLISNLQLQSSAGENLTADDYKLFLSNLAKDPSERVNRAKDHPEIVKKLIDLHQTWVAEAQQTSTPTSP